jgi:hypothetical protein
MPTATYVPIATITLTNSPNSVTFSSIPGTYRDLVLVSNQKGTILNESFVSLNGSSSGFSGVRMIGSGGGATSNTYSDNTGMGVMLDSDGFFTYQFMDYSATDKHKTILAKQVRGQNSVVAATAHRWANTSAITSITIAGQPFAYWNAGTYFSLYGIQA